MPTSSNSFMPMSTEANQEVCAIIKANLRILIRELGITQKRLAQQLGVATATMNDYCSGRRAPQATFFVELRKLYGIDINCPEAFFPPYISYSGIRPSDHGGLPDGIPAQGIWQILRNLLRLLSGHIQI